MKILQINCVYRKGSTGKITYDLHMELLDAGIESVVCYGRGDRVNASGVYKTCTENYSKLNNAVSRVTGIMYGGCLVSTIKLISIIKKENPDIVHLQCINGHFVNIYRIVRWLKKENIPTVLTLHAEFMYTGGCGYAFDCNQWKNPAGCGYSGCPRWRAETKSLFFDRTLTMWKRMKDAFHGFNNLKIVSVSPWLMERAKKSAIFGDFEHSVILNGLDISVFHKYDTEEMRLEFANKKIVFYATPYFSLDKNHIKGGWYICELAKRIPDIQFLVAGPLVEGVEVPDNVKLLGKITNQTTLAKYYSLADLTLLTSKRETFSMICAESLCCGTPIVGFKAGAPEQIALEKYSEFVDYGDLDFLEETVRLWLDKEKKDDISERAKEKYSKELMAEHYIEIYYELI